MSIQLSVLIPSLPERTVTTLAPVLEDLTVQARGHDVEVIVLTDNRTRTIGAKRNLLLGLAQGEYVAFVDDDDRVAPHYIASLCAAIAGNPGVDCIVFDVEVDFRGQFKKVARYGKDYAISEDGAFYYRKPNHLMCYHWRIAARHPYGDVNFGEDTDWSLRAAEDIVSEVRIADVLYFYDYVGP